MSAIALDAARPATRRVLLPVRDADDLHEVDLDAQLWNDLPEMSSGATHA